MKKAIIAVFSVSLTAGTTYLIYSQVKGKMVNKLVKSWTDEAKKKEKVLDEKYLKDEVDKLYMWDVMLLSDYYAKFLHKASKEVIDGLLKKVIARKIPQKADLKSIESVFGGS